MKIHSLSSTLILALTISLLPAQTAPKDPDLKNLLLYCGAGLAGIGLIKITNDKTRTGLTLIAIGAGMAAVAKPDHARKLCDKVMGTTNTQKALNCFERNFEAAYNWFPKV